MQHVLLSWLCKRPLSNYMSFPGPNKHGLPPVCAASRKPAIMHGCMDARVLSSKHVRHARGLHISLITISLQAACLARCNGARVAVAEAGSFSLEDFRAAVAAAVRSERDHIIVAYSRKAFLQTGAPGFLAVLVKHDLLYDYLFSRFLLSACRAWGWL